MNRNSSHLISLQSLFGSDILSLNKLNVKKLPYFLHLKRQRMLGGCANENKPSEKSTDVNIFKQTLFKSA